MRTRWVANMMVASSMIVLASCSNTGTGSRPQPVRSDPGQTASRIPPVNNPRDVAAVAHRTCDLLTSEEARKFGLDLPPTPSEGLFGTVYCTWAQTTPELYTVRRVSITVFTNNPTLEVEYQQDRNRPSFELTDVLGYPALVTRPAAGSPSCAIDIKLANRQSVSINYESRERDKTAQQPCEEAKRVAAAVVMNVPLKN